jgi:hypothetical protein
MTASNRARLASAWALVPIFALAGVALVAEALPSEQRQTREQHVFASVLDGKNTPVAGLSINDFVIREDGVAREVLRVSTASWPSHLVLLIDDSQATNALTVDLRAGLNAFAGVLASATPAPLVRLATFGDRPTTRVEFTTTTSALTQGIERIFPRPGAGGRLLEAIVETSRDLRARKAERPVIVAFVAEAGPEFSEESHRRIADVLKEAGVALWAVVLEDRSGQSSSEQNRERSFVLGDVVPQSGGFSRTILSRQGIQQAFTTLASALGSQYDVTYARPESLVPPTKLEVSLRQGGHRVVAPQWVTR